MAPIVLVGQAPAEAGSRSLDLAAARPGIERRGAALVAVEPGDRVRCVWRDRFAGDHAPMPDVVAALG